ncbi:DEAD/DEAH box helicase [Cupriavidus sp. SK-4]|uniref:DEAD/DEAH box helicase n=1 Tax=Cupriavidus sp. SK-4 TaxID=574750 RepID=UPI0009FD3433|nr:DEAD/DEAH box helicase [Cupriavidus sp. SK-4]
MTDLARLPEAFEELRKTPPLGYALSERLVDPCICIDKEDHRITAHLAGVRMIRGSKVVNPSPSNLHCWVVDGTTIRPLPKDAAALFADLLSDCDPEDLTYSKALELTRSESTGFRIELSDSFRRAGRIEADTLEGTIEVPGLNATLYAYQARGVRWMQDTVRHTGGLILADEMGLGKTLQIIALLLLEPPLFTSPALIVCPTSLIANWVRELERFSPSLAVLVHRGNSRAGVYRQLQRSHVVITTYDTMVNDISIFSSFEWSWVICDEAQAIKNPDSGRRKAIATIPRRRTIPMTGTPVENTLLDLWSLADFAIPGVLGSRSQFEANYPDSLDSAQLIGQLTDPIVLKRRVIEVANDLPDRLNIDVVLELDDELAEYYLRVREATLAKYPVAGALVATLQLQLVCAHPWLSTAQDDQECAEAEVNRTLVPSRLFTPKIERTVELLKESFLYEKKVIVFSLFNRVGDLIKEAAGNSNNIYWGAINGSTPQVDRQAIIDQFSGHKGPACLILNPKAAGAGLNITAATVVIHFTPVWNPALESQASARAHRRGQTQPVSVYRLFYKDTVEEVMIERSLWKSELANESTPVSSRDESDLRRALEIKPKKNEEDI